VAAVSLGVNELEGGHGEKRFPREARRNRLGRFGETPGIGVCREEGSQGLGFARSGRGHGAQELQELLTRADRETVGRVGNDVGVDMIGEMEADSDPARAGPCRVVVGDRGEAGGVRVADGHGRGWPVRMGGAGQLGRLGRRAERADTHEAFGVGRPKARMNSPRQFIEDAEQVGDE
jgi:hypothetical protein